MSILDMLLLEDKWNEFLKVKEESNTLPDAVIKKCHEFITNKNYKEISSKISNETYYFSVPKKVLIGKMGKVKKRAVYIYNEEENYVLKMINYLLYKYDYLFSPNLYSFRKNIGVKKAINDIKKIKQRNKKYVYKVDIKNYFNSIPVSNLLDSLKKDLNDIKLYNLIESILLNEKVIYNNTIIKDVKGIMAGVSISSFLANYYLKDLDEYFYKNNIIYLRYADDIIVFGNDIEEVKQYSNIIKNIIMSKGLEVNKEKEYFYNCGEKFEFLGFSFEKNIIDISENSFKKIKKKIRRTARGLRRWMIKNNSTSIVTLKAMNRKFNRKFYGKNDNNLTWKYWFFPLINSHKTLAKIDKYMQEEQRYLITGVHNKKNYEKVPYEFLKNCNYKPLVSEYYKYRNKI